MKTITTTYNPETHKLVPKDLADDTIDAACDAGGLYRVEFVRAWDAALAAAPEAPEQAEGQEQRRDDEPVAWGFHNTALTGRNRWMMLREQVPENDQYGGAMWTPLYAAPQPAKADNWQQYAKPGETAQQCIERHRAEQDALLTLLAQARSEPNAKAEGQEAVAFLVEGWHEGKLIAKTLEHTADEARGTAAVFAGHYPFIHTRPLYTTPQRREWVGLSPQEITDAVEDTRHGPEHDVGFELGARWAEDKLKEKNNG